MNARLLLDRDNGGAGARKVVHVKLGLHDHQVDVQRQARYLTHSGHDEGAKRDIRHEVPVHHVEMDVVDAGLLGRANLLAQARPVGGKNGWR